MTDGGQFRKKIYARIGDYGSGKKRKTRLKYIGRSEHEEQGNTSFGVLEVSGVRQLKISEINEVVRAVRREPWGGCGFYSTMPRKI